MAKEKKVKNILITGSSGTIGTRLFEKLLEQGFNVVGFDKRENKWHKYLNNLTILGDLLVDEDVKKIPKDIDLIVHLAANARVYDLVIKPDLALENIILIYNILEFARERKIKKIIFPSSREVYGNKKAIKSAEKNINLELIESPYSASKIAGEALLRSYLKCYSMDYIICRFSNVFGMYDMSDRFIPLLIRKMKKNENIKIFGKDKILDFTYIDDCVSGVIKCIENFGKVKNNVFNIASGKGQNLIYVAIILKKVLQSKSKILVRKNRTGEVVKFVANISRAKKLLEYKPKYSFKNSVKKVVNWYKSYEQKYYN